ncbi:MAG: ABC transporter ATP-binding protein [Tannerella sp.]|jgi:ABC-2 type transport system ATP-binding protein|nr:ABC transporter ATP-binding protein [Tannerella sp.]
MAEPAIEIKNLSKTYRGNRLPAVDNFSISIRQGEIFGLLGPNGAGKTTIINILCGLRPFEKGEIRICGLPMPANRNSVKPSIGVVPQEIALYPTLTAYENLKIFGGLFGIERKKLETRINDLLAYFGLEQNKHRTVASYSGGMKRRINLIAGLLHNPKILFLDEPTVGIDVQSKTLIIENLREINRAGSTIIYTSHYLEEAESLCSEIAIIDEGKPVCTGNPQQLIRQSADCDSLEALYLKLTGKKLRD